MGIGNFGELDSPETSTNSELDSGNQIEDTDTEKLDTGKDASIPEKSQESETDDSEKLNSAGSKNDYSYKHPDEGERPQGDFSYKHPDEGGRPQGDFSFKHPDEGKRPDRDLSYRPENNLSRESYEDDDPGEKSPYTRKLTR